MSWGVQSLISHALPLAADMLSTVINDFVGDPVARPAGGARRRSSSRGSRSTTSRAPTTSPPSTARRRPRTKPMAFDVDDG